MKKCKTPWNPQLVIPQTFQQCLTYEKQVLWLYKKIVELEEKVAELESRVDTSK